MSVCSQTTQHVYFSSIQMNVDTYKLIKYQIKITVIDLLTISIYSTYVSVL